MSAIHWHDHEGQEKWLREKRIAAVKAVYTEHGEDGLVKLGREVPEKVLFGDILAFCLDKSEDQFRFIVDLGLNLADDATAGSGFVWRSAEIMGFAWVEMTYIALQQRGFGPTALARFLKWIALSSSLYQFVNKQQKEVVDEYWKANKPWLVELSDVEKAGTIKCLLEAGRGVEAIGQIYLYTSSLSTELIIMSLRKAAATVLWPLIPRSHEVEHIFDQLYLRTDADTTQLAQTEWLCLPFISFSARPDYSRRLRENLTADATFFVELIELVYGPEVELSSTEETGPETGKKAVLAMLADFLLNAWHQIPGLDNSGQVDADRFNAWVETARQLAAEKRRRDPADLYIGRLLAHYPGAEAGETPLEFICNAIERINTRFLLSGFRDTLHNYHSFSSRSPLEGGNRERAIADHYRKIAAALLLKWPVTASLFENLADTYSLRAVEEDHRAQRESLDY